MSQSSFASGTQRERKRRLNLSLQRSSPEKRNKPSLLSMANEASQRASQRLPASQDVFTCPICQKDLTEWNTTRRNQHTNRCIDSTIRQTVNSGSSRPSESDKQLSRERFINEQVSRMLDVPEGFDPTPPLIASQVAKKASRTGGLLWRIQRNDDVESNVSNPTWMDADVAFAASALLQEPSSVANHDSLAVVAQQETAITVHDSPQRASSRGVVEESEPAASQELTQSPSLPVASRQSATTLKQQPVSPEHDELSTEQDEYAMSQDSGFFHYSPNEHVPQDDARSQSPPAETQPPVNTAFTTAESTVTETAIAPPPVMPVSARARTIGHSDSPLQPTVPSTLPMLPSDSPVQPTVPATIPMYSAVSPIQSTVPATLPLEPNTSPLDSTVPPTLPFHSSQNANHDTKFRTPACRRIVHSHHQHQPMQQPSARSSLFTSQWCDESQYTQPDAISQVELIARPHAPVRRMTTAASSVIPQRSTTVGALSAATTSAVLHTQRDADAFSSTIPATLCIDDSMDTELEPVADSVPLKDVHDIVVVDGSFHSSPPAVAVTAGDYFDSTVPPTLPIGSDANVVDLTTPEDSVVHFSPPVASVDRDSVLAAGADGRVYIDLDPDQDADDDAAMEGIVVYSPAGARAANAAAESAANGEDDDDDDFTSSAPPILASAPAAAPRNPFVLASQTWTQRTQSHTRSVVSQAATVEDTLPSRTPRRNVRSAGTQRSSPNGATPRAQTTAGRVSSLQISPDTENALWAMLPDMLAIPAPSPRRANAAAVAQQQQQSGGQAQASIRARALFVSSQPQRVQSVSARAPLQAVNPVQPSSTQQSQRAMPNYAAMNVQQLRSAMSAYGLRSGGRAWMVQRLVELYNLYPNSSATAPKRVHQPLDPAMCEQVTAALKKSAVYEDLLLFVPVKLKDVQRVLVAARLKVNLAQLAEYLTNQGAVFSKAKETGGAEE